MVNINNIPNDKLKHYMVGSILGLSVILISYYSILIVLAFAIGKEVYDKLSKKGTPEVADAVYTIVGGLVTILPVYFG